MGEGLLQQELEFLSNLFPEVNPTEYLLEHINNGKSFDSFIDNQFRLQDFVERNRKQVVKKTFGETESDEELKLELKNAVQQYKKNKSENNRHRSEIYSNSATSKNKISESNNANITTQEKANTAQHKVAKGIENLKQEEPKTNSEIGGDWGAISDVQQLINFFFLKKIDRSESVEGKKYSDYEKQGAIPKSLFRERLNKNSVNDFNNEHLKSKRKVKIEDKTAKKNVQKWVDSDHKYVKNRSDDDRNFSEHDSNDDIVKLCERACSTPFFYVVPENPSPNFLFSRGSYYVIPKHPDPSTGENIIHHPETTSGFGENGGKKFKIKALEPGSGKGLNFRNANDLGREVAQKPDSHLNIGPRDVKLNDSWRNLEANCMYQKSYDKTMGFPWPEQALLNAAEGDFVSSPVADHNAHFDEEVFEEILAAERLQKKIEDQFSRMLSALPESDPQELREVCDAYQGDEEQVDMYIEEARRKNKSRQRLLEMQFIFPDADFDYLKEQLEPLGDNDEAINILTSRLLDGQDYPKISDDCLSLERQRLWRVYVEDFKVTDYIRNVPNPGNLGDQSKNYTDLALVFLKSRYPECGVDSLTEILNSSNKNVIVACTSSRLRTFEPVRLANSQLKNKAFDETFLKQVSYIDHKEEIDKYLHDLEERKEIELEEARINETFLYCPLCCNEELLISEAVTCPEGDIFCKDCIKRYVFVKLSDGVYNYPCPSEECESFLTYPTLEKLLPDRVLFNIIKKQQAAEIRVARVDGLETCPFCEFAYIPNPDDKIFKCQNVECLIESCRKCHEKSHIPLHCEEVERSVDVEARKKIEETMTEKLVRTCPTCFKKFVKIDGCNKMVCTCGTIVCYCCRRKITDYAHFRMGACPLYSENRELHVNQVLQAGIEARNQIIQQNPDVRILHDPTTSGL